MLCSNKVRGKYYAKRISCIDRKQTAGFSRIEEKESIPTIRTFSHILDALGYELQIVKKIYKVKIVSNKGGVYVYIQNRDFNGWH